MIDCEVLYDKLVQFETGDEIAEFLEGYGIKGVPIAASRCPLAVYFETMSGQFTSFGPFSGFSLGSHRYDCTYAMTDFIHKFDCGGYPQLIRADG